MNTYTAKDLERLEEIFYRFHGVSDTRYAEFCEKNVELLHKDLLDAGDEVNLLESDTETEEGQPSKERRVKLW